MATKAVGQVDVVDVTDAYSVILTSEAHTFPGTTSAAKAGSTTTQVIAMQGSDQVSASVTLSEVTAPTGVTVTSDSDSTAPTLTIAVSTSVTSAGTITIPVHIGDITIEKTFSFAIAFTGSTGATGPTGAGATNIIVGLDTIALPANTSKALTAAQSITIPFAGYVGTTRAAATAAISSLPSGLTITTNTAATASADGSLVLSVASGTSLSSNISVSVSYTVTSLTFTRVLTISAATTGATGSTGSTGTSAITAFVGNQAATIACGNDGTTSAATTITIPFTAYQGTTRIAATIAVGTLPSGITAGTNTEGTASAAGSLALSVASGSTLGGNASGSITLTITAGGQTFSSIFSWSKATKGDTGATGDAGADALTLVVTSSNGVIFKNSSIATTLTAHVYKGGVEVTGSALTALGTIKWYKDGSTTATATGSTLTIDEGDVSGKATYVAQLEG